MLSMHDLQLIWKNAIEGNYMHKQSIYKILNDLTYVFQ